MRGAIATKSDFIFCVPSFVEVCDPSGSYMIALVSCRLTDMNYKSGVGEEPGVYTASAERSGNCESLLAGFPSQVIY